MTEDEMWEAELALWKKLSETPTIYVSGGDPDEFKGAVLKKLSYKRMRFSCPFCEKHHDDGLCPVGRRDGCGNPPCCASNVPYLKWSDYFRNARYHNQEYAKSCYDYLLKLKRRVDFTRLD